MKLDARARYTRHVIEESFVKLLRQKPAARITVRELCSICDINRATFYHHYRDIFDLLQQMEQALIDRFCQLISAGNYQDVTCLFLRVLEIFQHEGEVYTVLCGSNGSADFSARLFVTAYQQVFPLLQSKVAHLNETTQLQLYQFLSQGSGEVIHAWVKDGMKDSPQQVASFLTKAIHGVMAAF